MSICGWGVGDSIPPQPPCRCARPQRPKEAALIPLDPAVWEDEEAVIPVLTALWGASTATLQTPQLERFLRPDR